MWWIIKTTSPECKAQHFNTRAFMNRNQRRMTAVNAGEHQRPGFLEERSKVNDATN